jgi:hypothetical protein
MSGERGLAMPYRLPGDDSVRWRCLDSLAWALATLACALYLPQVGRTVLGELSLLYVGPILWGLLSVLPLREPQGLAGPWQMWRLRAAWLLFAGTSPFFGWWLRCTAVPYLAAVSAVAMGAAAWALLETTHLVSRTARSRGLTDLSQDALLVRVGLLYLLVIPIAALWFTFAVALGVGWATVPGDWLRFWRQIPSWGRVLLLYGPLAALLNLARLLLRASSGLVSLISARPAAPGDAVDESS